MPTLMKGDKISLTNYIVSWENAHPKMKEHFKENKQQSGRTYLDHSSKDLTIREVDKNYFYLEEDEWSRKKGINGGKGLAYPINENPTNRRYEYFWRDRTPKKNIMGRDLPRPAPVPGDSLPIQSEDTVNMFEEEPDAPLPVGMTAGEWSETTAGINAFEEEDENIRDERPSSND